jgi:hypothetical protein
MTPTTVITIEITIATIGRLTKNLATLSYLAGCESELAATAFSAGGVHGFAETAAPAFIFCRPSTTTFSHRLQSGGDYPVSAAT